MSGSWSLDLFTVFHQPPGAPCSALLGSGVSSSSPGSVRQPVRRQHHCLGLFAESGRHPFVSSQFVAQAFLCLCEAHRVRLVPQFIPGCLKVLVYTLSCRSQVLGSEWTLCFPAFRDLLLWPAMINLFATSLNHHLPVYFRRWKIRSRRHGCNDAVVGWSAGLCLPSLRPAPASHLEDPAVSGVGAHVGSSVLASTPLVSGPSGASGGFPSVFPCRKDLLRQPHFHRFHQNLPVLRLTAYRISSDPPAPSVSLQRWLGNLPAADAPPPE